MHARDCRPSLVLLAVAGGLLSAQPVRTPAPVWPGEAGAEADVGQNIFYDLPNAQAVIVTRAADGSITNEVRRDIPNRANPSVSFSVQRFEGSLQYSYVLTDPLSAKQRTNSVSVLLPDHDSGLTVAGWPSQFQSTTLPDRSATVSMATMRRLTWQDESMSSAKVQNLRLTLSSSYLPGFGDAEVEGLVNSPITPSDLSALPADSSQQLAGFLEPGIGSTRYQVLVPRFRGDTDKLVIASNYSYAVSVLSRQQFPNPGSPYLTQLAVSLRQFLSQGGASGLQAVAATPATPLEQAIQGALAIALQ
jgi:hypothetical protein